jgi:hypothetical protein
LIPCLKSAVWEIIRTAPDPSLNAPASLPVLP